MTETYKDWLWWKQKLQEKREKETVCYTNIYITNIIIEREPPAEKEENNDNEFIRSIREI